jgi:multimeric flavodoxin WrbA
MKIAVLNGSPKGDLSVTMQYVHYIQKKLPQHELEIHHISQRIKKIEKDEETFQEIVDAIAAADGVLWATPVYYLLVPAQYKRFIELIWERGVQKVLAGKYAAALTTSIRFYDHTAHNYLHAVSDDLEMRFVDSYSAYMADLMDEVERGKLISFAAEFLAAMEQGAPTARAYHPLDGQAFAYQPGAPQGQVDLGGKKILLVTDLGPGQENLAGMIERFRRAFEPEVPMVNLHELDIKGGCQGCLSCGYDNQCAYQDKDEFVHFYEHQVKTADLLVFAAATRDRYLSARWKTYFDRSFYNGHVPTLIGRQVGLLISGPLSQNANLRQILQAYTELQLANLAGIVTDESGDSAAVDARLDQLAHRLVRYADLAYMRPPTFLREGGKKLFRDEIWGHLRVTFQADHKKYKELGLYDFPQKEWAIRVQNALIPPLFRIRAVREQFKKQIKPGMVQPYKKVVEREG